MIALFLAVSALSTAGLAEVRAFDRAVDQSEAFAERGGWTVEILPRDDAEPFAHGPCAALGRLEGVSDVLEVEAGRFLEPVRDPTNALVVYRVWPGRLATDPDTAGGRAEWWSSPLAVAVAGAAATDELGTRVPDTVGIVSESGIQRVAVWGAVASEPRFERFSRALLVSAAPTEVWSCLVELEPWAYGSLPGGTLVALAGLSGGDVVHRPLLARGDVSTPGESWRHRSSRFAGLVAASALVLLAWVGLAARRHDQAVYRILSVSGPERLLIAQVEASTILVPALVVSGWVIVVAGWLAGDSRPAVMLGLLQALVACALVLAAAPPAVLALRRRATHDLLRAP
ncbi:MAG: hypothetical protein D6683_17695 [Actinomyces sp.]|nr:MAG: hypothetical protein D6683_17695 [Actinomyces sp.]